MTRSIRGVLTLLVLGSVLVAAVSAQRMTIPELIARGDNPVHITINRELVDPSLQDIVNASSLIVQGTVTPIQTYLRDDQRWVFTDYLVKPSLVIFEQKARSTPVPGQQELIVKVSGGKMALNGVDVIATDENLAPLNEEDELVLFLRSSRSDSGKYELVFEVAGAFEITTGKVRPLLKGEWMLKAERGITKAAFLGRLYQALDKRGIGVAR